MKTCVHKWHTQNVTCTICSTPVRFIGSIWTSRILKISLQFLMSRFIKIIQTSRIIWISGQQNVLRILDIWIMKALTAGLPNIRNIPDNFLDNSQNVRSNTVPIPGPRFPVEVSRKISGYSWDILEISREFLFHFHKGRALKHKKNGNNNKKTIHTTPSPSFYTFCRRGGRGRAPHQNVIITVVKCITCKPYTQMQ